MAAAAARMAANRLAGRQPPLRFAAALALLAYRLPDSSCRRHQTSICHSQASHTAYNAASVDSVADVPVPLCRRPAEHSAALADLLSWRSDVLARIQALHDAFEAADGGPGASELQREVAWALDDAVAAWREADAAQWCPVTWRQLQLELGSAARRGRSCEAWQVLLRAPVAHLAQLWRLRLEARVPFQYLIATAHWRDLVLAVGPGVLVPRPETEALVDLAAAALAARPGLAAAPWADLGTGSGAIAIATAALLQQQQRQQQQAAGSSGSSGGQAAAQPLVHAVDISSTAEAYARANAQAAGLAGAVAVQQGSWFEPLAHLRGRLGGVLSNPPYIPAAEMPGLQAEVGRHEPWAALLGGGGPGLDSLRPICAQAAAMLAPGGFLALETAGNEQALCVQALLQEMPAGSGGRAFVDVRLHDDCFGVPRFISASRSQAAAL